MKKNKSDLYNKPNGWDRERSREEKRERLDQDIRQYTRFYGDGHSDIRYTKENDRG